MHEQIINLGWAWHGYTCKCEASGRLYKKGIYKLKYFDNKTFKLTIRNKVIASDVEQYLIGVISQY